MADHQPDVREEADPAAGEDLLRRLDLRAPDHVVGADRKRGAGRVDHRFRRLRNDLEVRRAPRRAQVREQPDQLVPGQADVLGPNVAHAAFDDHRKLVPRVRDGQVVPGEHEDEARREVRTAGFVP